MYIYDQFKDQAEIDKRLLFKAKPAVDRTMCPICKSVYGIGSHLEGVSFTEHIANHLADHLETR